MLFKVFKLFENSLSLFRTIGTHSCTQKLKIFKFIEYILVTRKLDARFHNSNPFFF